MSAPYASAARVLVVDDTDLVRTMITDVLAAAGYSVHAVGTLRQALAAVAHRPGRRDAHSYDALVVDVGLGPDTGVDLVDWLRVHRPALIPRCVLLTGGVATEL